MSVVNIDTTGERDIDREINKEGEDNSGVPLVEDWNDTVSAICIVL